MSRMSEDKGQLCMLDSLYQTCVLENQHLTDFQSSLSANGMKALTGVFWCGGGHPPVTTQQFSGGYC